MNKKASATASTSRKERDARLDGVHAVLTKYFLGSVTTADKFWGTNNPSLGYKSPANLVKAGKLKVVEHYVDNLRKHTRSARPDFVNKPTDGSYQIIEGNKEKVLEKLKEIPAGHRVIVICFENAESYCTYAPVVRRVVDQLPKIVLRVMRRDELLCARLLYAFTADLPVTFPKLKPAPPSQQRKAARKLAAMGGKMPGLGEVGCRRAPRQ